MKTERERRRDEACTDEYYKKDSKKFKRLLKDKNIYEVFSALKHERFPDPIYLNKEALVLLSRYIERYKSTNHIIDSGFDHTIHDLLNKVRPESVEEHIRCIAPLRDVDIPHFRLLFGYNKIYQCFKESITNLFVSDFRACYIGMLIRLLNNSKLVFKNILPIISRLNLYTKEDLVDKNIGACCCALDAIATHVPEHFNDVLITSLINYIARLLSTPHNYLFLTKNDIVAIKSAFGTLCRFDFKDGAMRQHSLGLLRSSMAKIREYHRSTVCEEVSVVLHMTDILTPMLELYIRLGNTRTDFIDIKFLNFDCPPTQCGPQLSTSLEELRNQLKRQSSSHRSDPPKHECDFYAFYDEAKQGKAPADGFAREEAMAVQAQFIEAKYKFLDKLSECVDCFDRICFYNDLLRIKNPTILFNNIPRLKEKLDWSDLIVFACNSKYKCFYIPVVFDDCYLNRPAHSAYINIFLDALLNVPGALVFFAKFATDKRQDSAMMKLYLCHSGNKEAMKKARTMVLKYIINYQLGVDESPEKNKKYIDELRSRVGKTQAVEEASNNIDTLVKMAIEELTDRVGGQHIAALVTVFLIKKISGHSQLLLYRYMRECISNKETTETVKRMYTCLCAIILKKNDMLMYDTDDVIIGFHESILALLNYNTIENKKEADEHIKIEIFNIVFKFSTEQQKEIAIVSGQVPEDGDKSEYLTEYNALKRIIYLEKDNHSEDPSSKIDTHSSLDHVDDTKEEHTAQNTDSRDEK